MQIRSELGFKNTYRTLNITIVDQIRATPLRQQTCNRKQGRHNGDYPRHRKRKKLDALESFHIYKEAKARNQINDKLTVRENELFKP